MIKVTKSVILLGALVLCTSLLLVHSEEYGRGHYTPGEEGSFAGVLPEAGRTRADLKFYWNEAHVDNSKQLPLGQNVGANVDGYRSITYLNFTHVSDKKIVGGDLGFDLRIPFVYQETTALVTRQSIFTTTQQLQYSDNSGIGDIVLTPLMLGWHKNSSHFKTGVSVFMPTGEFDKSSIANTGLNYWTYMPFLAYTNVVPGKNEISIHTGVDFNTKNTDTNYQTGTQWHMDYVATHYLDPWVSIGLAGTVYQQIESDSGDGAVLGGSKAQAYGIGPVLRRSGRSGDKDFIFEIKWIPDFDVKNRPEGNPVWFNFGSTF